MSYECMIGLNVTDDENYNNYRDAMTPLLESVGGGFRYDFKVSEILINEEGRPINRVFAIYFPNEEIFKTFFGNPDYQKARSDFFEKSVDSTTFISQYLR